MNSYTFDVHLLASITVQAASEREARTKLREAVGCASTANLGAWADGSPILAEVSIDGEPWLVDEDDGGAEE